VVASDPPPAVLPLPPALPTGSTVSTAPVAVDVEADSIIRAVRAEGLREVRLDGKVAHLVVEPWSGALTVDAELAGNKRGRGVLAPGVTRAKLASAKPPVVATPRRSELQEDPYGR
jgi:hypothetical protein